jgi:hypothetical protein
VASAGGTAERVFGALILGKVITRTGFRLIHCLRLLSKRTNTMASTANMPLHRQLQLHPSLYCLMATDDQAATMLHLVADAIEHEGLSGQTVEWLRWQARAAFGAKPGTNGEDL